MFNTTKNHHKTTGIAFGVISANSLDSDLVHELMFGDQATDHSYNEYREQAIWDLYNSKNPDGEAESLEEAQEWLEENVSRWEMTIGDRYQQDEPEISGEYEGVTYATSWGSGLCFFILESPNISNDMTQCSPCYPGAGDLDSPGGGYTCYDVPADWRYSND